MTSQVARRPAVTSGERRIEDTPAHPFHATRASWEERKRDPRWLLRLLQQQYTGEVEAVLTMTRLSMTRADAAGSTSTPGDRPHELVERVLRDEHRHIGMLVALLAERGERPRFTRDFAPLPGLDAWPEGCAAVSLAEAGRLAELRLASDDPDVPADVRAAFAEILRDEAFHEKAFRSLAGEEAMRTASVAECCWGREPNCTG